MKREEVDRRVKEEVEKYSEKFSPDAAALCRGLLQKEEMRRLGGRRLLPREGAEEVPLVLLSDFRFRLELFSKTLKRNPSYSTHLKLGLLTLELCL